MKSSKIMRSDDLRTHNRHRILQTLRNEGPLSRAEIGKKTGLSQAALSTLFGMMSHEGIVTSKTSKDANQKRGRPRTTIALDSKAGVVVTVALTIDHISFSLVNYSGETLKQINQESNTKTLGSKQLDETLSKGIKSVLTSPETSNLKAICIGFQGVTDAASGVLVWSPILSIDTVPIGDLLSERFEVPVIVNNDCGLIATALHKQEAKNLGDSFATVLFSHGIGLGVYLGGEPFTGARSSALELGHVCYEKEGALCRCGKTGCIEAYAADYGLVRATADLPKNEIPLVGVSKQTLDKLVTAANNNGLPEQRAFEEAGKAIGFGLATLFTLLDPLPVALVGHNTDAVNLMRTEIEKALSTVSRGPENYSTLVHCYGDNTRLLLDGLIVEAMALVDKEFAQNPSDALFDNTPI